MAIERPATFAASTLAEQALTNLVNQFARPLDFVRELAQNAIDAGTPRIDVSVGYTPPEGNEEQGALRITFADYGEGMDEDIIDNQLTRLFSSSKEHDLTKIGKFGIGFTSIFAIRPEAVLLRTGRQGEYWELLFHPDRSFDKVRLTEPVRGTTITLFKRMPQGEVATFVREMRFVLDYWCEHSETPITFEDRTRPSSGGRADPDDPFGPFVEPTDDSIDRVDRALTLDASIEVRHVEPGLEVVVGFPDESGGVRAAGPRFGFYNGGLTLLNTQSPEVLGTHASQLGHLTFKVKYDRLEHTLTRDNVLQDENLERALAGVARAHAALRERMLTEIVDAAANGRSLRIWQRRLAADCRASDGGPYAPRIRDLPVFSDVAGRAVTLATVRAQQARVGTVLVGSGAAPLYDALTRQGFLVLEDSSETRGLLEATEEAVLFEILRRGVQIRRAEELFVSPGVIEAANLDPDERALVRRAEEWLGYAVGLRIRVPGTRTMFQWAPGREGWLNRLTVRVGDFGGTDLGRTEVLALNGPPTGDVFLRPEPARFQLPAFVHWRCLLVNRHHPLFRAQLLASREDLDVAAFGLASALLHVEAVEGEAAHRRMLGAVFDALTTRGGST